MHHYQDTEMGGESYPSLMSDPNGPISASMHRIQVVDWWLGSLCYGVAPVSVAMLILRLWATPRKRWRLLTQLPGAVAGGTEPRDLVKGSEVRGAW